MLCEARPLARAHLHRRAEPPGLTPLPIDAAIPAIVRAVDATAPWWSRRPLARARPPACRSALLDAGLPARGRDLGARAAAAAGAPGRAAGRRRARRAGRRDRRLQRPLRRGGRAQDAAAVHDRGAVRAAHARRRRRLPGVARRRPRRAARAARGHRSRARLAAPAARGRPPDLAVVAMSATLRRRAGARVSGRRRSPGDHACGAKGGGSTSPSSTCRGAGERPTARSSGRSRAPSGGCCARRRDGDLLVFLPGRRRDPARAGRASPSCRGPPSSRFCRCTARCRSRSRRAPCARPDGRKIVLATNVAESSVTIDGVVGVIDAGLARIAAHSPWTGLPTLALAKISQAAADQRAGRAGRTRPGRALRLYTRHDFEQRPGLRRARDRARRSDRHGADAGDAGRRRCRRAQPGWSRRRPQRGARRASCSRRLGAIERGRRVSPTSAGACSALPVHPRLARLVVEGETRGAGDAAAWPPR